jgi:chemotaxis protein CheC
MVITEVYKDALEEIFNIGIGQAASLLNEITESHISLQVTNLDILSSEEANDRLAKHFEACHLSSVCLDFRGAFSGAIKLIFPVESATELVTYLNDDNRDPLSISQDWDFLKIGTLTEVGNIILNGVMGPIANLLNCHISYFIPVYLEGSIQQLCSSYGIVPHEEILLAQSRFLSEGLQITGEILLIFHLGSLDALMSAIDQELLIDQ